jgi:DUF4097 and DUF4098 domain-containing protein YvlB
MNARISILSLAFLLAASASTASPQTYTKTFPVAGRASVHVNADDASLRVTSSDSPQVEFRVEYAGYTLGKNLRIDSEQNSNEVELTARTIGRVGFSLNFRQQSMRIDVRMPKDADLRIETGDGSVNVSSINGNVSIRSGDGGIKATSLSGKVDINTGDGSVRANAIKGELRLHTGDGSIEGTDLDGKADVSTGDGRVRLAGRFDSLNVKSADGSIGARIEPGSKMSSNWNIRSADGSIDLTLPADFRVTLDASTSDGSIDLGFPVAMEGAMRNSKVRGTLNGGGPTLMIRTSDGAIRLEKG